MKQSFSSSGPSDTCTWLLSFPVARSALGHVPSPRYDVLRAMMEAEAANVSSEHDGLKGPAPASPTLIANYGNPRSRGSKKGSQELVQTCPASSIAELQTTRSSSFSFSAIPRSIWWHSGAYGTVISKTVRGADEEEEKSPCAGTLGM